MIYLGPFINPFRRTDVLVDIIPLKAGYLPSVPIAVMY
jgi:hypothetical protein